MLGGNQTLLLLLVVFKSMRQEVTTLFKRRAVLCKSQFTAIVINRPSAIQPNSRFQSSSDCSHYGPIKSKGRYKIEQKAEHLWTILPFCARWAVGWEWNSSIQDWDVSYRPKYSHIFYFLVSKVGLGRQTTLYTKRSLLNSTFFSIHRFN